MAFAHLGEETLNKVRQAAIALGFNSEGNLDALAAGMNPAFRGSVSGPSPNAKLLMMTQKMNTTRVLLSGEIPLRIWLSNAIMLAAGSPEELVFRDALAEMSVDAPPPDAPKKRDVDEAPRTPGGSLEIDIDEDDTLGVGFLLLGAAAAGSVAKLMVHRHFDGQPSFVAGGEPEFGLGTGWLHRPPADHHQPPRGSRPRPLRGDRQRRQTSTFRARTSWRSSIFWTTAPRA